MEKLLKHILGDQTLIWNPDVNFRNNPKNSDKQVWANGVDLNRMPSEQGLHCLPVSPAGLDRLMGRKFNLFKF